MCAFFFSLACFRLCKVPRYHGHDSQRTGAPSPFGGLKAGACPETGKGLGNIFFCLKGLTVPTHGIRGRECLAQKLASLSPLLTGMAFLPWNPQLGRRITQPGSVCGNIPSRYVLCASRLSRWPWRGLEGFAISITSLLSLPLEECILRDNIVVIEEA